MTTTDLDGNQRLVGATQDIERGAVVLTCGYPGPLALIERSRGERVWVEVLPGAERKSR